MPKRTQMKFSPNTGYAFAVGDNTWHSADRIGPEVKTRDSILLTYFVDQGPLRVLRNRGKRVDQFRAQRVPRQDSASDAAASVQHAATVSPLKPP